MILTCTSLHAQQVIVRGTIIDQKTIEPVFAATITAKGSRGTVSDPDGKFEIRVEALPVTLTISHVSYGRQNIELKRLPGELVIRLESNITRIPEVMISGTRMQVLNKRARFSVSDYQIDGKYLWFLGFQDNSPKKGRLFLANLYGDTISSFPVKGDERLIRSCFGTIHLIRKDTVFQLFTRNDSIWLLYPEKKDFFLGIMSAFETSFNDGLARLEYKPNSDQLSLVYIDSTLMAPAVVNLNRSCPEEKNYMEKRYAWIGRYFGSRTLQLVISQQLGYYFQTMRSSLFALRDTLYALNLKDNQLHAFDNELSEFRVVPISFHLRETADITNVYIPFQIILDRQLFRAYVVYHLNSNWSIVPLDQTTGLTGPEIQMPAINAMHQLTIHGNALYFLYPEKTWPYYQRLYRLALQ
ncbi:MAG: carboxypeptidase-like regulatory domain-containing protein [Bacteroidales bacterium]